MKTSLAPAMAALVGVLTALSSTGCIVAKDTHFAIADDIDTIVVRFENGDIEVRGDEYADEVVVDLEVGGLGFGDVGYTVDGGTLFIDGDCGRVSLCGGDVIIQTPPGVALDIDLNAGDLSVDGIDGDVFVGVGAGDIELTDLRGSSVTALLGAGDAEIGLRDDFAALWVEVGTGSLELDVPAGGYRMSLDAGAGDIDLEMVSDDSQAAASIDAYTGAGEIRIRGW